MNEISFATKDLSQVVSAVQGKWDRHSEKDVVWAVCGRIVLLEGSKEKFPLRVIGWHDVGSLHIGILGTETISSDDPEEESSVVSDVAKILETARSLCVDLSNDSEKTEFDGSSNVDNIRIKGLLDDSHIGSSSRWNKHLSDKSNPHEVTAEQIGACSSEELNREKSERQSADNYINEVLIAHKNDKDNPHEVTASQTGAYTKAETDQHIASAVSGVGTFLGILTCEQIDALTDLHTGDYVDVADNGFVHVAGQESVAVLRGDTIVFNGSTWVRRLNDGKGLFVENETIRFG